MKSSLYFPSCLMSVVPVCKTICKCNVVVLDKLVDWFLTFGQCQTSFIGQVNLLHVT